MVKEITSKRTSESLFFKLSNLFIPLKSIIPIPTEIKRADNTGFETTSKNCPRPKRTIKRKIPLKNMEKIHREVCELSRLN